MDVDQPLHGHRAEPDEEGHVGVGLPVVRQPLQGVDVRLLDDIRCGDSPPQFRVEAELDHLQQASPMIGKLGRQRPLVASLYPSQHALDVVTVESHDGRPSDDRNRLHQ